MVSDGKKSAVAANFMILIAVVILPLSLAGRNAGNIIFSKGRLATLITDTIASYDDDKEEKALKKTTVLKMIEKFEKDISDNIITPENREENLIKLYGGLMVFGSVESHQINTIIRELFPRKDLFRLLSQVIDPLHEWLESGDVYPGISVDITPLKDKLSATLPQLIEIPMGIVPNCDDGELNTIRNLNHETLIESLPLCAPQDPGPERTKLISFFTDVALEKIENHVPDILPLNEVINPRAKKEDIPEVVRPACMTCHDHGKYRKNGHQLQWIQNKNNALRARAILSYAFILPIILSIPALYFLSGSKSGGVQRIGWWLTSSGLLSFLLVLFIKFGAGTLAPDPMAQYVASSFFAAIARPLFLQSVAMTMVGCSLVWFIKKRVASNI